MAQSDYGMRGEAAMRMMKGGKKGQPPEDDLGLPPEENPSAPPEGGGGPMDLMALLGGGGAPPPPPGGGPPPDASGQPPMPGEGGQSGGPMDIEQALGGVEASLEGLPPELAEEIRTHLNAIREIASRGTEGSPQMPGDVGAGDTPEPLTPTSSEKQVGG